MNRVILAWTSLTWKTVVNKVFFFKSSWTDFFLKSWTLLEQKKNSVASNIKSETLLTCVVLILNFFLSKLILLQIYSNLLGSQIDSLNFSSHILIFFFFSLISMLMCSVHMKTMTKRRPFICGLITLQRRSWR